jgi:hypothetical protein
MNITRSNTTEKSVLFNGQRIEDLDIFLGGDKPFLLRYRIILTKPKFEYAFPEQESLLTRKTSLFEFGGWAVADFLNATARGDIVIPASWREGNYPHNAVNETAHYRSPFHIPKEDQRYITFDCDLPPAVASPPNSTSMATELISMMPINPMFKGRDFRVHPSLCFVRMPFRNELRPIYDDHIRKAIQEVNLECQRGDDIFSNTAIVEDIWKSINEARTIIADLTGKNPNVFYEVGIAHTLGKDVILITQSIDDVPFDLRYLRCIQYQYTPRGVEAFEQELKKTLLHIINR